MDRQGACMYMGCVGQGGLQLASLCTVLCGPFMVFEEEEEEDDDDDTSCRARQI